MEVSGGAKKPAPSPQGWRALIPTKSERKKLVPLAGMFFCILFNYTILRDTKVCVCVGVCVGVWVCVFRWVLASFRVRFSSFVRFDTFVVGRPCLRWHATGSARGESTKRNGHGIGGKDPQTNDG